MATKKPKKSRRPVVRIPSDALFKKIMGDMVVAREFLEYYLPSDFKKLVNLSQIKVEKESYVESNLKRSLSDVVYSIKTKDNEDAFVYVLIESQSTSDYWLALRLWKYMLLLCERHKDKSKKNKLPLIAPIVFYHGAKEYDAPKSLWELFTVPEQAKKLMGGNYQLVDIQSMSDLDIRKKQHLGMLEHFMRHVHDRDLLKAWENFLKDFKHIILIDKDKALIYIRSFLWYTESKLPEKKQEELGKLIVNYFNHEQGENLMRSIAQKHFDDGFDQGETKGMKEAMKKTAINMLQKKLDVKLISQVTGLSELEINRLKLDL